jgi:hypothetical protein
MLVIWLQGIWLPLHGYDFANTPLWAGIAMMPMLAGRRFFPHLISPAFAGALSTAFRFSFIAYVIAAAASWMRGGTYRWSAEPASEGEQAILPLPTVLSR